MNSKASFTRSVGFAVSLGLFSTPLMAGAQSPSPDPAATAAASSASPAPAPVATEEPAMTALATSLLGQAQSGQIDRKLFDAKMNAGLTPTMVGNVAQQLAPLGKPKSITFVSRTNTATYAGYRYSIVWDAITVEEQFAIDDTGKIIGWFLRPQA